MKRLIFFLLFGIGYIFANTFPGLERTFFDMWHCIVKKDELLIGGTQTGIEIRKVDGNQTKLMSRMTLDRITQIALYKNFVVAKGDNGLYFIDISDIGHLKLQKTYPLKMNAFLIIEDYLLFATPKDEDYKTHYGVYDISDIENISLVSSREANGEYTYIGVVKDGYVGFMEELGQIDIVDITDMHNLEIKYLINNSLLNINRKSFFVSDNKLYTLTTNGADTDISIYDISDLANISKIKQVECSYKLNVQKLVVYGSLLIGVDGQNSARAIIMDLNDTTKYEIITVGTTNKPLFQPSYDIYLSGNEVYIASNNAIERIRLGNAVDDYDRVALYSIPNPIFDIEIYKDKLYLIDPVGIKEYSIQEDGNLLLSNEYNDSCEEYGSPKRILFEDRYAIVGCLRGIEIYDSENFNRVAGAPTNGYIESLYIENGKIFISEDSNTNVLEIMDINGEGITKVGSLNFKGVGGEIAIIGNDLFMTVPANGAVGVIDISDITNPVYVGLIDGIYDAMAIMAYKKYLFVSTYKGLYIVGDEYSYKFDELRYVTRMEVIDDKFLLTLGIFDQGLHLLDLNLLLQGKLVDYFEKNSYSGSDVEVYDKFLYFSHSYYSSDEDYLGVVDRSKLLRLIGYGIKKGWNLVAPLTENGIDLKNEEEITIAWKYRDGRWKLYAKDTVLEQRAVEYGLEIDDKIGKGEGAWIWSVVDGNITQTGVLFDIMSNDINLSKGWNLIGSGRDVFANELWNKIETYGAKVKAIWGYRDNRWYIYVNDEEKMSSIIESYTNIEPLYAIEGGEGVFIYIE